MQKRQGFKITVNCLMNAVIACTILMPAFYFRHTIEIRATEKCASTEFYAIAQCDLYNIINAFHTSSSFKTLAHFCKSHKMICQTIIFTHKMCMTNVCVCVWFMQFQVLCKLHFVEFVQNISPVGRHLWLSLSLSTSPVSFHPPPINSIHLIILKRCACE